MAITILGTAAAVLLFPQIDLAVSRLFWRSDEGFFLVTAAPLLAVYRGVSVLTGAIIGLLVAAHLFRWITRRALWGLNAAVTWYLATALVLGPFLLTNVLLKGYWGRVRPFEAREFGGETPFTPVFEVATAYGGRSFPSGHAAIGFFLLAFCEPVRDRRRRRQGQAAAAATGLTLGLCRIAQGGHFLTDVLLTGPIIYVVVRGLAAVCGLAGRPLRYGPVAVGPGVRPRREPRPFAPA
jgi:lipid A 4'-phosphatase